MRRNATNCDENRVLQSLTLRKTGIGKTLPAKDLRRFSQGVCEF
jgi:hypothetical protein